MAKSNAKAINSIRVILNRVAAAGNARFKWVSLGFPLVFPAAAAAATATVVVVAVFLA